ncbi:GNAT family N-acetyltransferase [Demequina sp. TTPB684]|uniref:GNAT family N-acetyltransferase n=1 Tax=unclassified Demequina TaxID=2620311 RepID=UPI001CF5614F|nr:MULTISPECIES: GNAT family N-acetyltransferase [unclassified Demequina]MCB2412769.1 GNAT family N-acetyltransferase [Demequina sp. TTPB684]UPU87117.1 GNAT family N-acetyltransferase [Demequina sp. TMPB413]
MTLPSGYRLVDLPFSRRDEMLAVDQWAFAMSHPESVNTGIHSQLEWDRCRGIENDKAEVAAVHSSYGYTMRVPGGTVAASGLTWVGVHPGERRRGLLRGMIDDHFKRSLGRGEPVSTLTASEPKIYQRFGYGLACPSLTMTMPRGATFRPVPDSEDLKVVFDDADLTRHASVVRSVIARDQRPGTMLEVSEALMAAQFADPEVMREGQERKRIMIVEDDQGPAAFAIFQRKLAWGDTGADGTGSTSQWAAATPAAARRLWSVLADLDLLSSFTTSNLTIDEPAILLADDVRALALKAKDHVWLRILDVPAALMARTYRLDLDLVVEIEDTVIPANAGRWRLSVTSGQATVTQAEPGATSDVGIGIQDLSAAYLGGPTIDSFHHAGLVREVTVGAASLLSDAMRSVTAPRTSFSF